MALPTNHPCSYKFPKAEYARSVFKQYKLLATCNKINRKPNV